MAVRSNVGAHFPCPNHCGESYRQEEIENHRDICRLEEIAGEFSDVGCKQRFEREKQEDHIQDNTQQHLSLAASQAIGTQQQLQHHQVQLKEVKEKLEEDNQKQNNSLKEVEEKIMEDVRGLRNIVQQQQQTLIGQEVKLKSQDEKLKSQDVKLKSQEQHLKKLKFERKVFAFFGFVTVLLLAFFIYFAMDLKEEGTHKLGKLQNKYGELQNKYGELQNKYRELQNKYGELKNKYGELQNKYGELQNKYGELKNKYGELQNKYTDLSNIVEEIKTERRRTIQYLCVLTNHVGHHHVGHHHVAKIDQTFEIKNFSSEKAKGGYWTSPAMYTHVCGYRFFLRIFSNGRDTEHEGVDVALVVGPGQFDDLLSWPAKATFSFNVTNSLGGTKRFVYRGVLAWNKPENLEHVIFFTTPERGGSKVFFDHSNVRYFLLNDTLKFSVHVKL